MRKQILIQLRANYWLIQAIFPETNDFQMIFNGSEWIGDSWNAIHWFTDP